MVDEPPPSASVTGRLTLMMENMTDQFRMARLESKVAELERRMGLETE